MSRRGVASLAAALGAVITFARAEVSVVPDGAGGVASVLEMVDRSTQPPRIWSASGRPVNPAFLLNVRGDLRGDGPPSIVRNPITRLPEAVWSLWDGDDYEVAWSRFEPAGWTAPMLLSNDGVDDRDPRLHIDAAGNRRVVSWRQGSVAEVVLRARPANDQVWWEPQVLSNPGEATRWPDVVSMSYGTFVAAVAEVDGGAGQEMVVFESPLDGHVPQRTSDPWGRSIVQRDGLLVGGTTSLISAATAAGPVPVLTWRQGDDLATTWYDASAGQWSTIVLAPWPVW